MGEEEDLKSLFTSVVGNDSDNKDEEDLSSLLDIGWLESDDDKDESTGDDDTVINRYRDTLDLYSMAYDDYISISRFDVSRYDDKYFRSDRIVISNVVSEKSYLDISYSCSSIGINREQYIIGVRKWDDNFRDDGISYEGPETRDFRFYSQYRNLLPYDATYSAKDASDDVMTSNNYSNTFGFTITESK